MQQLQSRVVDAPVSTRISESNTPQESWKLFWLAMIGILVVAGVMYATLSVYWLKFSRAEVFFAECAREMIVQNNMVTPLYHAQPFFDKPILSYWLIIAMFKTFGVAHWTARVPSIVASLVTIGITAATTRAIAQRSKNAAGVIAAMLLSSSFMFFSFSYLCMSDMTLVMFDTITLVLAYLGITNERRRTALWLAAAASMGFAFVTKGPVGIVLPGLATVIYLAITRQLKIIKPLHVVLGVITAILIGVPWFYMAFKANGPWALYYFFIGENLGRYTGDKYDTHKPVWFMIQSLILGFLPWTPFIPFALKDQWKGMKENAAQRLNDPKLFMWIWTAVLIWFFSFSRGKCDYYALPVYPAVASLVALYMSERSENKLQRALAMALGIAALAAGVAGPIVMSGFAAQQSFASYWIMPTALVLSGAAGLIACANKRMVSAFTCLFVGMCLGIAGFAAQVFPAVMDSQSLSVYADTIAKTSRNTQIGVHKDLHHWVDELTFQSQREPVELHNSEAIASMFLAGPAIALIPEDVYHEAIASNAQLQNADLQILDRRRVSTHPLTPGYILKRKGNIYDRTLLLIAN